MMKKSDRIHPPSGPATPAEKRRLLRAVTLFGQLSWMILVPIVGLTFLGVWLTDRLQTGAWLTVVCLFAGLLTAAGNVLRTLGALGFLGDAPSADPNPVAEAAPAPAEAPAPPSDHSAAAGRCDDPPPGEKGDFHDA